MLGRACTSMFVSVMEFVDRGPIDEYVCRARE